MKMQGKHSIVLRGIVMAMLALGLFTLSLTQRTHTTFAASSVTLSVSGRNATVSNGIYTIKFNSAGKGTSLVWNGKELIGSAAGFYSSINGGTGFSATALNVVTNTSTMVDLAYISSWGEL